MNKFTDNKNYDAGTSVISVVIGPYEQIKCMSMDVPHLLDVGV